MGEKDTTCPITETVITATTSLRPTVPDRQAFQQALREYNQSISETAGKVIFLLFHLHISVFIMSRL